MRALAAYIMKGRMQAILVAAVTAVLSLLLMPLSYLSGATVALVTLRVGLQQGLFVIFGAGMAAGLLFVLITGSPLPALAFVFVLWLPVMILAISLRRTASLPRSLLLGGVFGAALVLGIHAGTDNPAQWWQLQFEQMLQMAAEMEAAGEVEQQGLAELREVLLELAQQMTGILAAALSLTLIGSLLIGRWWQAMLYNPGGFRQEFHALKLGRGAALGTVALLVASMLDAGFSAIAADLLIIAGLLLTLQGIAVAHGLVAKSGASTAWLIGMYVLLALPMTMGQMMLVLVITGFGDNFFDFRAFFGKKAKD